MRLAPNDPRAARATSSSIRARSVPADARQLIPVPTHLERTVIGPTWLVLPYPPALNTLYGHRVVYVKGRPTPVPYKTHAHRDYCDGITVAVAPWPKDVALAVTVKLYRPRRVGDIDGPLKTLFDALNGRAWADDSQIVDLHITRHDDKARPRVEVGIRPAALTQSHAATTEEK